MENGTRKTSPIDRLITLPDNRATVCERQSWAGPMRLQVFVFQGTSIGRLADTGDVGIWQAEAASAAAV